MMPQERTNEVSGILESSNHLKIQINPIQNYTCNFYYSQHCTKAEGLFFIGKNWEFLFLWDANLFEC